MVTMPTNNSSITTVQDTASWGIKKTSQLLNKPGSKDPSLLRSPATSMNKSSALVTSRTMEQRHKLRADYTSKLEVESQRMEDRLKMLKTMLAAEKARRNVKGGIHWKSTNSSPKKPVAQRTGEEQSPKPIRVRVLTNKEEKNKVSASKSTPCGQCDKSNASLNCIECVENYCQVCFVRIHQKGALANHHVKPLISKVGVKQEEKAVKATAAATNHPLEQKQTSSCAVGTIDNSNSLLDGTYDEAASAASFQQALAEWRTGRGGDTKKATVSTEANTYSTKVACTTSSTSTSTNTTIESSLSKQKKVEISFSQGTGVSYLEKLITRRSRYDPTLLKKMSPRPAATSVPPVLHEDSDYEGEIEYAPSRYNVFCILDDNDLGDFSEEDCEELSRPLSSVKIQEITEPVIQDCHVESIPQPQTVKDSKTAQPKKNVADSTNNGKIVGCRKKSATKTRPRSTTTKRLTSKAPPHASESDLQSCVQRAWTDCSEEKQNASQTAKLSQFFLQGVESQSSTTTTANSNLASHSPTDTQLNFAATVWLPFNSVAVNEETHAHSAVVKPDSDSDTDNNEPPLTDLPSRCNSALSTGRVSHMEVEQAAERQEWDREDSETLETLAWELMSTVESEGRLSRCESVLDSIDHASGGGDECHYEDEGDVEIEPVDINKVMNQFELYQQQLLDEEL